MDWGAALGMPLMECTAAFEPNQTAHTAPFDIADSIIMERREFKRMSNSLSLCKLTCLAHGALIVRRSPLTCRL